MSPPSRRPKKSKESEVKKCLGCLVQRKPVRELHRPKDLADADSAFMEPIKQEAAGHVETSS
jgi:hypothetical protein